MKFKHCKVQYCINNNRNAPKKLFFPVPKDEKTKKLWSALTKSHLTDKASSACSVCEDHFNLEDDVENSLQHRIMGTKLKLKPYAIPSKCVLVVSMPTKKQEYDSTKPTKKRTEIIMDEIDTTKLNFSVKYIKNEHKRWTEIAPDKLEKLIKLTAFADATTYMPPKEPLCYNVLCFTSTERQDQVGSSQDSRASSDKVNVDTSHLTNKPSENGVHDISTSTISTGSQLQASVLHQKIADKLQLMTPKSFPVKICTPDPSSEASNGTHYVPIKMKPTIVRSSSTLTSSRCELLSDTKALKNKLCVLQKKPIKEVIIANNSNLCHINLPKEVEVESEMTNFKIKLPQKANELKQSDFKQSYQVNERLESEKYAIEEVYIKQEIYEDESTSAATYNSLDESLEGDTYQQHLEEVTIKNEMFCFEENIKIEENLILDSNDSSFNNSNLICTNISQTESLQENKFRNKKLKITEQEEKSNKKYKTSFESKEKNFASTVSYKQAKLNHARRKRRRTKKWICSNCSRIYWKRCKFLNHLMWSHAKFD